MKQEQNERLNQLINIFQKADKPGLVHQCRSLVRGNDITGGTMSLDDQFKLMEMMADE